VLLTITRFISDVGGTEFEQAAETVLATLAEQPGYIGADLGRSTDNPNAWCLVARFADPGSLRRAQGAYPVKVALLTIQQWAITGGGVYEVLAGDTTGTSDLRPDAVR
jgi:antibiotic biosynthesis monooxygenase (ABM) superfamily enzyme